MAAARLGVFHRVLNFFPKTERERNAQEDALEDEVLAMFSFRFLNASHFQTSAHTARSRMLSAAHVKTSSTTPPRASSEPPPSPDSRSSRDGWLPKARPPPAGTGSFPACVPARPHPVKLSKMAHKRAQQRWSGLLKRIAKQVRATLGDALWADFVAIDPATPQRVRQGRLLKCLQQADSLLRAPPARRCVPTQLQHRRDMRESVRDARRAGCASALPT